jgi:OHCU decarboxylase
MPDVIKTLVLAAEHDDNVRRAVLVALREMGGKSVEESWGLAGSQEIERLVVEIDGARVTLEAETNIGLSIAGESATVDRIDARVRELVGALSPRRLDRAAFVARFGSVFEHSPWIAEAAFDAGLPPDSDTAEGLWRALCAVLRVAPGERQRALILAHPDLAGRLARAGRLTADSAKEQSSAGLDTLTDEERARFTALNEAYKQRFGIPFIMAVKGRGKAEILAAFERRLANDADAEFAEALAHVERIALLRLKDLLP